MTLTAVIYGLLVTRAFAAPLQYLTASGDPAKPVVWLTWGVLAISVAVVAIIAALLAGAIWHRPGEVFTPGLQTALQGHEGGLSWLWIGVGLSALALLVTVVWTVKVLAAIQSPQARPAITIEVTGRQWWWQVRYLDGDPARSFTTANEIHLPVGRTVRLKLAGGDVIHSFWVPQLAGKMDAIPGQTNETWIEASAPGIYRGQCGEYCGLQHAKMALEVVAESPAQFARWWDRQLASPAPLSGRAAVGQEDFVSHCGGCHAVRGTQAQGALGPDLSHLMLRGAIASGTLPNTPPQLARWIADPQAVKPGSLMPQPSLSQAALGNIQAYLETLR